ncbi:hypothetical protein PR202_ga13806 [Eleusine coracana subsp. coracana]|uniref:WRKY domain-containing protein n=1 Tax=Eleusine coracana subsp. coracana TaxID=191504 RepID=A0AAV5CFP9_ELECO|nr:hypothetical protein PR202_ga13806 [Eleusine coracana subsp. coracana]
MVMETVEEANRAAVESCKKLVTVLSRSGDPFQPVAVAAETDDAVRRFGKVVAVLSDRIGHARARIGGGKRKAPPVDASCLMDHPSMAAPCQAPSSGLFVSTPPPPTMRSVALMSSREAEVSPAVVAAPCASVTLTPAKFDRNMFLETPLLDLNSCGVQSPNAMALQKNVSAKVVAAAVPVANPSTTTTTTTTQIQFQPQQQAKAQKSFLFDQTPSAEQFHIEVPRGAKEVISFSFDNNSVCTSSAATSFFTSISSQLISMSDAATSSAATGKKTCGKRGEDGGVKCHCPKKKKPRDKRVVRVPAISDKNADIPADNYSWRKYGQKPIKGSPHPSFLG